MKLLSLLVVIPLACSCARNEPPSPESTASRQPDVSASIVQEVKPPPLDVVRHKNGRLFYNMEVRSVSESGITFLGDQGLVQLRFEELPPEYYDYYRSQIRPAHRPATPTPSPQVDPAPRPARTTVVTQNPSADIGEARREVNRLARIKFLKDSIRSCEVVLDRYSRQSAFKKEDKFLWVSDEERDLRRAQIELYKEELRKLE